MSEQLLNWYDQWKVLAEHSFSARAKTTYPYDLAQNKEHLDIIVELFTESCRQEL